MAIIRTELMATQIAGPAPLPCPAPCRGIRHLQLYVRTETPKALLTWCAACWRDLNMEITGASSMPSLRIAKMAIPDAVAEEGRW
jgi:hypothetical protein